MRLAAGSLIAIVLIGSACASDPLPGYREASPADRAALLGVVREYYDVFDLAQVTGDLAPLYARHPELAHGEDRPKGINTEAWTVERTRVLGVRDVNVDVESYEPFRAFTKGDDAVAYSHGLFTWSYATGGAGTKGELFVRFDLVRNGDRWTIERTDEWVLGEGAPSPTPR